MFVSSLVRWFVSSVEMSKFWLKFLYWCISHKLNIRNHSYLDYRYPIRLASFLWVWTPGSMPGGGARVQNPGHL